MSKKTLPRPIKTRRPAPRRPKITRAEPAPVKLGEFFDAAAGRLLVRRVWEVARTERERRVFGAILRRAYEDTLELEILYRELPGLLANEGPAIERFQSLLDKAGQGRDQSKDRGLTGFDPNAFTSAAGLPDRQPCGGGQPFIDPVRVSHLVDGIDQISRGDPRVYDHYLGTLDGLWRRGDLLDQLYRQATHGPNKAGHDPLGDDLRLIARATRPGQSPGDSGGLGQPAWEGAGLPGGGEGVWPPPDDNVSLQWPPPEPGGGIKPPPRTPCEFMDDLCRRLVLGGGQGLRTDATPLPDSCYTTGIVSISPTSACAGEKLTIQGTGFGATQPPEVNVLIGTQIVSVVAWSDTAIIVTIPAEAHSGCVGFRNERLEFERLNRYSQRQDNLASAGEGLGCWGSGVIVERLPYRPSYPGCTGVNFFAGTVPEIDYFKINGAASLGVEPNQPLTLTWQIGNAVTWHIRRLSPDGPPLDVANPAGSALVLGPFTENRPVAAVYELTATNACGTVRSTVSVRLRKIPVLRIEGLEVTQGIQVFWRPGVTWNSLPTIAGKDTIVRVYISTDLGGFNHDQVPHVSGTLEIGEIELNPINGFTPLNPTTLPGITVGLRANIDRTQTNHTLNFRIPAALATGSRLLQVRVNAPQVEHVIPTASQTLNWSWQNELPLRVRFVCIRDDRPAPAGTNTQPALDDARLTVQRAFDLLPSPPTDIAPASPAVWPSTRDFTTLNGLGSLLDDLDNQHDCSFWEWLWEWTGTTDCPADDQALWLGLTQPFNRGLAGRPGNTAIAAAYQTTAGQGAIPRTTPAHELSHNLGFRHVNRACNNATIGEPFYEHPDNGDLQDVPFDPYWNQAIGGSVQDYMSYGCTVWVSADSWTRLQDVI